MVVHAVLWFDEPLDDDAAAWSVPVDYGGRLRLGVMVDEQTMPDPDGLLRALERELAEFGVTRSGSAESGPDG